jgi:DNA helicase-2/ATP-dependent DNA helicase PcrA
VALARDPQALALYLRRPIPAPPSPQARRGTAFHAWVERRLRAEPLVDLDDLPGAQDLNPAADSELDRLRAGFEASEWADRRPIAVEVDVETPVAGTILRGRIDAVFARPNAGVDIVDWKTGPPPSGADLASAAVQLAVYRVAWSRLHDLPLETVHAAFCFVGTGQTLRPADHLGEEELLRLIESVPVGQGMPAEAHAAPEGGPPPPSADRSAVDSSGSVPGAERVGTEPWRAASPHRRGSRARSRHGDNTDQLSLFDV